MGLLTEMLAKSFSELNESSNTKLLKTDIPKEWDWSVSNGWTEKINTINAFILESQALPKMQQIIDMCKEVAASIKNNVTTTNGNKELVSSIVSLGKMKVANMPAALSNEISDVTKLNDLISILAKNSAFCKYVHNNKMEFGYSLMTKRNMISFFTEHEPDKAEQRVKEFWSLNLRLPSKYEVRAKAVDGAAIIRFYVK